VTRFGPSRWASFAAAFACALGVGARADAVRVATYNLDNYLAEDRIVDGVWRPDYPKPEAEKAALRAIVANVAPDVLVLQEMGPPAYLAELRRDLRAEGLDYPHAAHLRAADRDRHLAVLSRLPFAGVERHADLDFAYLDGRLEVKRGMLEVAFDAPPPYGRWLLFAVHLKSPWTERAADPRAELRRAREARACRNRVIERGPDRGFDRYLVAGDFNAPPGSAPRRRFLSKGDRVLGRAVPARDSRGEYWTYFYEKEKAYTTVDGFIASPAFFPAIRGGRGRVVDAPGAMLASDHRMVVIDLAFPAAE